MNAECEQTYPKGPVSVQLEIAFHSAAIQEVSTRSHMNTIVAARLWQDNALSSLQAGYKQIWDLRLAHAEAINNHGYLSRSLNDIHERLLQHHTWASWIMSSLTGASVHHC